MAPFSRPAHFNQAEDALFGCPCGKTGKYGNIVGHRHGWKMRPACNGPMIDFDPPVGKPVATPVQPPAPPPLPEPTVDPETGEIHEFLDSEGESVPESDAPPAKPFAVEADPILEGDEEEIARQINARRGITADPAGLSWWETAQRASPPPSDEGGGSDGGGGDDETPGDWRVVPPGMPTKPSQARETVVLPVQVRLMYDWMRGQGWHVGEGTLSDWVTDMVLDHWKFCLGKGIFILDREEVQIA